MPDLLAFWFLDWRRSRRQSIGNGEGNLGNVDAAPRSCALQKYEEASEGANGASKLQHEYREVSDELAGVHQAGSRADRSAVRMSYGETRKSLTALNSAYMLEKMATRWLSP